MPPFWIVLLDNIGLAALVAMGLVLLTGVGGLTSFGQAAFCGFGAYTTAVLTTAYGVSPWLTLPLSLAGRAASRLCCSGSSPCGSPAIICRSAPSPGASACTTCSASSNSSAAMTASRAIPPLSIGSVKMIDPGAIYYRDLGAVLIAALLTHAICSTSAPAARSARCARGQSPPKPSACIRRAPSCWCSSMPRCWPVCPAGSTRISSAPSTRRRSASQAGIEYLFIAVVGGAGYVWGGVLGRRDRRHPEGSAAELSAACWSAARASSRPSCSASCWSRCCSCAERACGRGWRRVAVQARRDGRPTRACAAGARSAPPARPAPLLQVENARKQFGGVHRGQRRLVRRPGPRDRRR